MFMRDMELQAPIIRNHIMMDVFSWMQDDCNENITGSEVPHAYRLAQNYPNPFNPSTTIQYSVREKERVAIRIYDVAGRLVRTLVDERHDPGSYSVRWNGRNNNAGEVGSGVYFYEMKSGNFRKTRKMVVLR